MYVQINTGITFTEGVHQTLTIFRYYGRVVSPSDNHTIITTPNLMTWLQHNPHLRVTREPTAVTVGGEHGTEIDVEAVKPPDCTYYVDGSSCWNIMPYTRSDPFSPANQQIGVMLCAGTDTPPNGAGQLPSRIVLVHHGDADIVLFWVDASASFPTSVTTFETVLKTLTWQ